MTVAIKFLTEFDGKALSKGAKELNKFSKTAKKLAGSLGIALGATAMINFAKASVRAAGEAEKANIRLLGVVKNIGLAFASTDISRFLDDISKISGIDGAKLASAFQPLLTTTRSLTKSQELLRLALDVSAGSSEDISTVTNDLALAYVGNTKSLKKYNLGLTQAELKSKSFEEIAGLLNKQFSGSNARYLETYAGKMQVLGEASENAKEIIGQGIIDALLILSKNTSIEDLSEDMAQAAKDTSKLLTELAKLKLAIMEPIDITTSWLVKFINATQKYVDLIVAGDPSGFFKPPRATAGRKFTGGQDSTKAGLLSKSEREAAAALKKRMALEKAAAAAKLAAEKKAAVLAKGNAVFDLEQIGLAAALKMSIDKETRLRLELLQAIQLGDTDKIIAKMKELYDYQQTSDIAKLARSKTISEAQLTSINTTLLSELDAISKLKVSEEEKARLQGLAFTKYNDAIKYAGGLAALSTYSQKLQDQELMIQRLASIYAVSAAQTAADNIKQAALEKYLETLGKPLPVPKVIPPTVIKPPPTIIPPKITPDTPGPNPEDLPNKRGLPGLGGGIVTIIPKVIIPDTVPIFPDPETIFPGSSKDEKDARDGLITAITAVDAIIAQTEEDRERGNRAGFDSSVVYALPEGFNSVDEYNRESMGNRGGGSSTVVNFNAPITTTSTDEFARAVQKAIQNEKRFGNNLDYAGAI